MSDYPNTGTIKKNKYKKEGTKMPDSTGDATVTCKHCGQETSFVIAGWTREGRNGKFGSLRFTEKTEAERRKLEAQARKRGDTAPSDASTPQQPDDTDAPKEGDVPF